MEGNSLDDNIWTTNAGCIETRLSKFIDNNFLADMTFLVGRDRQKVPGHKFILSTCSWEFYNVFNLLQLDKNELLVEDVEYPAFRNFLTYCYTGKVVLSEENTLEILKLAQRFNMEHLIGICEEHIGANVTKRTCMVLYSKSMCLKQDSGLKEKILSMIEENFSYLVQDRAIMKTFVDLPLAAVRQIAALEHLQCDEMELFDALMKWATHMCRKLKIPDVPKNLRKILCDVFCMIRFPIMKIEWFLEILAKYPEILTPSEIALISLTIRGDVKSCSKFSNNPRKNIIPMLRNAMKLDIAEGKLIPCFLNTMQPMNVAAMEITVKFRGDRPGVLIGYAFIAKKGQEVNQVSCKLRQEQGRSETFQVQGRSTALGKRYKLSWDYDLMVVCLGRKMSIMNRSNVWNELICTFDKPVVHITTENTSPFVGETHINGIYVMNSQSAIVPYLIFE
ncbi:BTB/POZ domain-containing protein 3-like [Lutzomyia longipalpis]|uniref:BTB/POZ domain-containing protein 3-like n=1 Tax=Lutzomyia longipalpis TaxID=7200 RepID=UPI00248382ED|nr:BTB/POZ domain-containing protein 3-like [Lutzomyia longipalpis]